MLATVDPALLDRVAFPLGDQESRARATRRRRPGSPSRERPESQEACFLAGDDYRAFLERQGLARRAGPDRRRARGRARSARRRLALHAGPAARDRHRDPGAAVRAPHRRRHQHARRRARAARSRSASVEVRGQPVPAGRAGRGEAALPLRPRSRPRRAHGRGFRLQLDEPASAVAPGQVAVLYDDDAVVGAGIIWRRSD